MSEITQTGAQAVLDTILGKSVHSASAFGVALLDASGNPLNFSQSLSGKLAGGPVPGVGLWSMETSGDVNQVSSDFTRTPDPTDYYYVGVVDMDNGDAWFADGDGSVQGQVPSAAGIDFPAGDLNWQIDYQSLTTLLTAADGTWATGSLLAEHILGHIADPSNSPLVSSALWELDILDNSGLQIGTTQSFSTSGLSLTSSAFGTYYDNPSAITIADPSPAFANATFVGIRPQGLIGYYFLYRLNPPFSIPAGSKLTFEPGDIRIGFNVIL